MASEDEALVPARVSASDLKSKFHLHVEAGMVMEFQINRVIAH